MVHAIVRVSDDGIGIPRGAAAPRLRDVRSGQTRSRIAPQGAWDWGLTLVRHLVELHGGSAEAHSAGEGRGSEFVVRLPLAEGI